MRALMHAHIGSPCCHGFFRLVVPKKASYTRTCTYMYMCKYRHEVLVYIYIHVYCKYNISVAHMSPAGSYVDPVASNSQKETDLSVTELITKN